MALAAGTACFFGREFVGRAFFMGGAAALAGDFALLCRVHGSKTTFAGVALPVAAAAGLAALLTCFVITRCGHDDLLDCE